ncbi:hypothetical protein ACU3L3_22195 [Priestia endophytica]|uniref:hypothetical protein n=1 Tax=Priestia endophytica TaxID=135735 RepID=UPI00111412C0|nr:hypothetical protein [Priestia endophytica]
MNIWNFAATIVNEEKNFVDVINQEIKGVKISVGLNVRTSVEYQALEDLKERLGQQVLGDLKGLGYKV